VSLLELKSPGKIGLASCLVFVSTLIVVGCMGTAAWAQAVAGNEPERELSDKILVPHSWRRDHCLQSPIQITQIDARVEIRNQVASTLLEIALHNTAHTAEEAEFLIPVPANVTVHEFSFSGLPDSAKTEVLTADKARAIFDEIVRKLKDPALLEFAGMNLIRSSAFPLEANGRKTVRIRYEQLLVSKENRIDYVLPRSGNLGYTVPWNISFEIHSERPITAVYSPSHQLTISPSNKKRISGEVADAARGEPGDFRMSYLVESGDATASLYTWPDKRGNRGYFLFLAGFSERDLPAGQLDIKREITMVLDRSGSMSGEKFQQAKQALQQVLAGLQPGELFNIIAYNDKVESFQGAPIAKSPQAIKQARRFIDSLTARDGTNLHEALAVALRQPTAGKNTMPIVLFLTDGLPTVGITSEVEIRKLASEHNPQERRVFTFGVGYDVNTPLLDKVARLTRAFATFVIPGEDVEVKVGRVFKGLDGPQLADVELRALRPDGTIAERRITDLLPHSIPDLYQGDQLVLLGRYHGARQLRLRLTGRLGEQQREFEFKYNITRKRKPQNAFVGRLWASRKIAGLIEQIRDLGAETQSTNWRPGKPTGRPEANSALDARIKELTDEIVALSTEFGIITEYTSFLATESADFTDNDAIIDDAVDLLSERAMATRSGQSSWNQEGNLAFQRSQQSLNKTNKFYDAGGNVTSIHTVQQCRNESLYLRNGRWVEAKLLPQEKTIRPDRVIEFGSPAHLELVWKLVARNRQDALALDGDILIEVDGETLLVKASPGSGPDKD